MNALTSLLLPLAAILPAAYERKFDAESHAKAIAPFVDSRTFAVVHVDLSQIQPEALAQRLAIVTGNDPEQKAAVLKGLTQVAALTKVGAKDIYVILSLADIPE